MPWLSSWKMPIVSPRPSISRDTTRSAPYNVFADLTTIAKTAKTDEARPADYLPWGSEDDFPGGVAAKTIAASFGGGHTTNWTYDGTLVPGWQVTPGITFYDALTGYTPTLQANYMQGAKSVNVYVLFNHNPTTWQGGINFTAFFGGNSLSQPYADRNFVGLFVTRNF